MVRSRHEHSAFVKFEIAQYGDATQKGTGMRFTTLDGLRGVAALAVLWLHTASALELPAPPNAGLAVDFFFCLSGFVLSRGFDHRLRDGLPWRAFMRLRMVRLYPMLALGVLLGTVANMTEPAFQTIAGLAMVPLFFGALAYPVNFPMWSLFFEIVASAWFGAGRGRENKWLLIATLVFSGISLTGLIILAGRVEGLGLGGVAFFAGFSRLIYPFAVGVLMSRINLHVRAPRLPPWVIATVALGLFLAPVRGPAYDIFAALLAVPVLVLLGANAAKDAAPKFWAGLGELSYPLYLVHVPVVALVTTLDLDTDALALLCTVSSLYAAWIALTVFDRPVRVWLSRPKVLTKPYIKGTFQ